MGFAIGVILVCMIYISSKCAKIVSEISDIKDILRRIYDEQ